MDLIPAIAYRRVSTEDQSDYGYSLPKQQEYIARYAHEHGLDLVADFAEDISGMTPFEDRPAGRQVIDLLERRQALAVVAHETDRLSRDIVDLLGTVQRWVRAGVQVHTCDMGQVQSELDIGLVIRGWQGGSEHRQILERTTRGKLGKAEAGKWVGGTPPYGYRQQGYRREARMMIDEPEAETVRQIYRWYTSERLPMLAIADRLNRAGIPTQRGSKWWRVMVKKILSNETYVGVVYYAGIRIDLPELAIIPRETFERAQALKQTNRERAARNRQREHEYVLSGHFRCECGQTMSGAQPGSGGGRLRPAGTQRFYYRCAQFQWPHSKQDCPLGAPHANGFVAEHIVWSHIVRLVTDDEFLQTSVQEVNAARQVEETTGEDELAGLERKITTASRKIDLLLREFGDEADDETVKALKVSVRTAQRERDEAKVQRAMLLNARREVEQAQAAQERLLQKITEWRAVIDQADYAFKCEVLDLLDVRVRFVADGGGGAPARWGTARAVEVTTALSLAKRYPYAMERRYKKQLKGE